MRNVLLVTASFEILLLTVRFLDAKCSYFSRTFSTKKYWLYNTKYNNYVKNKDATYILALLLKCFFSSLSVLISQFLLLSLL